ncbi:MAG: hypothetical protein LBD94_01900 [Rickettsiales bacterium]|jgi:hypothetical protein|nr:hypothetical protein [Rickettsiales bacterium]
MDAAAIAQSLGKSGYQVLGIEGGAVILEDPTCIIRNLSDFIDFAWIVMGLLAMILLFGWGIALIRAAEIKIIDNLRNLFLLFSGLAVIPALVGFLLDKGALECRQLKISVSEINRVLAMKDANFGETGGGNAPVTVNEAPSYDSPIVSSGASVATGSGDVAYVDAEGNRYVRVGGTRAWRNNNPGNIRYSEFSRSQGAIGEAGGFAVFPDERTGANAIGALLRTDSYNSLTIFGAINRYAPPFENDTAAYQRRVEQLTGLPGGTPMNQLNNEQLQRVVNAIRVVEGWVPGQEIRT